MCTVKVPLYRVAKSTEHRRAFPLQHPQEPEVAHNFYCFYEATDLITILLLLTQTYEYDSAIASAPPGYAATSIALRNIFTFNPLPATYLTQP